MAHSSVSSQRLLQDQTLWTLQRVKKSATRHHTVRRHVRRLQSRRQLLLSVRSRFLQGLNSWSSTNRSTEKELVFCFHDLKLFHKLTVQITHQRFTILQTWNNYHASCVTKHFPFLKLLLNHVYTRERLFINLLSKKRQNTEIKYECQTVFTALNWKCKMISELCFLAQIKQDKTVNV